MNKIHYDCYVDVYTGFISSIGDISNKYDKVYNYEEVKDIDLNYHKIAVLLNIKGNEIFSRDKRREILNIIWCKVGESYKKVFTRCLLYVYGKEVLNKSDYDLIKGFEVPWYTEGWNTIKIIRHFNKDLYNIDEFMRSIENFELHDGESRFTLGDHLHKCAVMGNTTENFYGHIPLLLHDIGKVYCQEWDCGYCQYPNYNNIGAYESLFYFDDTINGNNTQLLYNAILIELLPIYKKWEENRLSVKDFLTEPFYKDLIVIDNIDLFIK